MAASSDQGGSSSRASGRRREGGCPTGPRGAPQPMLVDAQDCRAQLDRLRAAAVQRGDRLRDRDSVIGRPAPRRRPLRSRVGAARFGDLPGERFGEVVHELDRARVGARDPSGFEGRAGAGCGRGPFRLPCRRSRIGSHRPLRRKPAHRAGFVASGRYTAAAEAALPARVRLRCGTRALRATRRPPRRCIQEVS